MGPPRQRPHWRDGWKRATRRKEKGVAARPLSACSEPKRERGGACAASSAGTGERGRRGVENQKPEARLTLLSDGGVRLLIEGEDRAPASYISITRAMEGVKTLKTDVQIVLLP